MDLHSFFIAFSGLLFATKKHYREVKQRRLCSSSMMPLWLLLHIFFGGEGKIWVQRGGRGKGAGWGKRGARAFILEDLQIPIYLTLKGREVKSRTVSGKPRKSIF